VTIVAPYAVSEFATSTYHMRQLHFRVELDGTPVQGTTFDVSLAVMMPFAITLLGSAVNEKTGPPLSPLPMAFV
jgi:hypothetical protein